VIHRARAIPTPRRPVRAHATRGDDGFTLVEVLLAVIILALGVLGLTAIFAGAVAQQQRATEINRSVGVTRNAEALLRPSLGALEGPGLNTLRMTYEGQWLRLPVHPRVGAGGAQNTSIGLPPVTPGPGATALPNTVFFAVPEPPMTLFDNPTAGNNNPAPIVTLAQMQSSPNGFTSTLPFGSLSPERFALRFSVTLQIAPPGMFPPFDSVDETVVFTADDAVTQPLPATRPLTNVLFRKNVSPGPGVDQVEINFGDASAGIPAQIIGVDLQDTKERLEAAAGSTTDEVQIETVVFEDIFRENRDLVSLSDRLVTTESDEYPTGERPIMGYTTLYRLLDSGSQMAIITYSLRPKDPPRDNAQLLPFFPPETPNDLVNEEGVIRSVEADLGFDETREQYFLEVDDLEEDGWAIEPGQVIFMASSAVCPMAPAGPAAARPGADAPVRVLSQQQTPDEDGDLVTRAFLDDSPRFANGRSPLSCFSAVTGPGSRVTLSLYAVFPTAISRSTRTEWEIRPVEVRIFQLTGDS